MRRFLAFAALLLCSFPIGVTLSGCSGSQPEFCPNSNEQMKTNQVASVILQPQFASISLSGGQTQQLANPTAETCLGSTITFAATKYTFGSSNQSLITTSPSGNLCAGTWNVNTGGGIPPYSVCTPATASGSSAVTASIQGVTSNTVLVYVHPQVTSAVLYQQAVNTVCPYNQSPPQPPPAGISCTSPAPTPSACQSQTAGVVFCALVCSGTTDISALAGQINYSASPSNIVSIDQFGSAIAQQPGTAVISALVSGTSSTAGLFSTCPPTNISISVPTQTGNNVTIYPNNTKQISYTATDTNNMPVTGLDLTFTTNNLNSLSVSASGSISSIFPSDTTVYGACLPPSCNPSPLTAIGVDQTGLPVMSNPIHVTAPGNVSAIFYLSNFTTPFVGVVNEEFQSTPIYTPQSPLRLQYVPNSMVLSPDGTILAFGSGTQIMAINTATGSQFIGDRTVTGQVLAISADDSTIVVSNPTLNNIYLYATGLKTTYPDKGPENGATLGSYKVFGGSATTAEFSPDAQTVYLAGGSTYYVYNTNTGWSTYPAPNGANGVAVTVPAVAAFFAGTDTTALGYCADFASTPNIYFPPAADVATITDAVAATNDGNHILGASAAANFLFSDIGVTIPIGACPPAGTGITIPTVLTNTTLPTPSAVTITNVYASPDSTTAFTTYSTPQTPPAVLPAYQVATQTLVPVPLAGTATAPLSGVFSPDNSVFYVSTTGDNLVHVINVTNTPSLTDVAQFASGLVDLNNNPLPANAMAIRSYASTK